MKKILITTSFLVLSVAAFANTDHAKLVEIQENADVGNGSATIKKYNIATLDTAASLKKDISDIKKEFPECGPFKTTTGRRETINSLRNGKSIATDETTANALEQLYKQNKIAKMYSIQTNNEIDCSRMWVEVYTTSGELLDLYYGMND